MYICPASNQSFEEGIVEDFPVARASNNTISPGPSTTGTDDTNTSPDLTVFKRPNPLITAVKALRKGIVRPNILKKRKPARSALQDIKYLQSIHQVFLQTTPFARLVHDVLKEFGNHRVTSDALMCFKEAYEFHLQELIDKAKACTIHHKCITLSVVDLQLARYLSGDLGGLSPPNTKEEHWNLISCN